MKTKFIVSVLYNLNWIGLVILTLVTVLFLVTSIINMHNKSKSGFDSDGIDVSFPISVYNRITKEVDYSFATDNTFRYMPVNEYTVDVKPNTPLAYYFFIFKIIFISLAISGSWLIQKILKEIKKGNPFNFQSVKYLKIIAIIFISSDILKFINNLIFNQFIRQSESQHGFQFPPITLSISNGILLGMVIWILAVIFQRGVELQTENDLTV